MTPEIIEAIGNHIVVPIAVTLLLAFLFWGLYKLVTKTVE